MSDHDTDERDQQETDERPEDATPDEDTEQVSSSGVELEGYESRNNPSDEREAVMQADSPDDVDDDLLREIEEERERRLDPDNRPPHTEVDNTQRTFLTEEARFEDSEVDQDPGLGQGDADEAGSGDAGDAGDNNGAAAEDTGTRSEDDAGQGAGEQEAAPDPGQATSAGKHKA